MGIGSNLGDSRSLCLEAVRRLSKVSGFTLRKVSSLYITSPVGYYSQNDFVNMAVLGEYLGTPKDLLCEIKQIEKEMGRKEGPRWGPRTIDIDILLFGNFILEDDDLKIPHPELHRRRFAIIPLLEIEKDLLHPLFNKKLKDILLGIDRSQKVRFLERIDLSNLKGLESF